MRAAASRPSLAASTAPLAVRRQACLAAASAVGPSAARACAWAWRALVSRLGWVVESKRCIAAIDAQPWAHGLHAVRISAVHAALPHACSTALCLLSSSGSALALWSIPTMPHTAAPAPAVLNPAVLALPLAQARKPSLA